MQLYISPADAAAATGIPEGTFRALMPRTGGQIRRRRIGKRYHWHVGDFIQWANRVLRPPLDVATTEHLAALATAPLEFWETIDYDE